MKKIVLMAAIAATAIAANAQNAIQAPRFSDNWSLGLDGGVTTPMNHHAFFGDMRAIVGLHLDKQITPAFAIGAEGAFGINTSRWYGPQSSTAFDNSYVGVYGAVNLFNLFGGYQCAGRPFDIEAVAGAGWGHYFETRVEDENFFATKVGLNFNFNERQLHRIAQAFYRMGHDQQPRFPELGRIQPQCRHFQPHGRCDLPLRWQELHLRTSL